MTGKRISAPLVITITTWPSRTTAERALSVKMLMPPFNDKLPMFACKLLCLASIVLCDLCTAICSILSLATGNFKTVVSRKLGQLVHVWVGLYGFRHCFDICAFVICHSRPFHSAFLLVAATPRCVLCVTLLSPSKPSPSPFPWPIHPPIYPDTVYPASADPQYPPPAPRKPSP